ncbi:MAG: agmatinase [Candidatus Hodarchaeales archaeon]|jgi:agmatinase
MKKHVSKSNEQTISNRNTGNLFFGALTSNLNSANLAVLGVPWDSSSSYRIGSAEAPQYIREATTNQLYNSFSERGINIKDKWKILDCGDIKIGSDQSSNIIDAIYSSIYPLTTQIQNFCFLGGDHLTTYFSLTALLKASKLKPERVGLIYFDSHPDLYDEYDNNNYSHACVMKRIISDTGLLPQNICQLGIRAATPEQLNYIQKENILMYTTQDMQDYKIQDITNSLKARFQGNVDYIYLSVDLDVLDPVFVPGIGNPEPGGLTTVELIRFIQNLNSLPIYSFDLVEINPKYDLNNLTAFTSAKLMKEILAILT